MKAKKAIKFKRINDFGFTKNETKKFTSFLKKSAPENNLFSKLVNVLTNFKKTESFVNTTKNKAKKKLRILFKK